MTPAGAVALVILWALMGTVAYAQAQVPYGWNRKVSLIFAIGGPVTAMFAMLDIFQHTSMGGDYTREWQRYEGQDIVTWREKRKLRGLPQLVTYKEALSVFVGQLSLATQLFGCYACINLIANDQFVVGTVFDVACIAWFSVMLSILLSDVIDVVDPHSGKSITSSQLTEDLFIPVWIVVGLVQAILGARHWQER